MKWLLPWENDLSDLLSFKLSNEKAPTILSRLKVLQLVHKYSEFKRLSIQHLGWKSAMSVTKVFAI